MKRPAVTTPAPVAKQPPDYIQFPGNFRITHRTIALYAILLFTFLIYSTALKNHLLVGWDDGEYISNPVISGDGPIKMPEIFSNFYLGMYQPLAILSFAINHKLSGASAWPFILTNILLHLLNTMLVFKLAERWMKGWIPAGIVALLFAIHPMHVEAVAWISTRSSGLYSLFFLLGLIAWEKYLDQGFKSKYFLLALVFMLLSLFSKSMAATFPLVLLLMDFIRKRAFSWRIVIEKLPFFALSVIFGVVAIRAAASFGHITVLETDYSLLQRFFLILYGIGFYLIKLVAPVNLSAIYAFPELVNGQLPAYVFTMAILPVAAVLAIWLSGRNRKEFAFAGLFSLFTISMVLPLFWSRVFITADRYTYIPYIGLFMIVARLLTIGWESRRNYDRSTLRMLLFASILVLITLSAATISRISIWRDTPTLLTDVIDNKRSDADMAHGYFYLANHYDAANKTDEAMKYYNLALSRNPAYLLALNNRGILKGKAGDMGGAVSDFNAAIRTKPDYAEAFYNRGLALYQTGRSEEACSDWQKALQLKFHPARDAILRYCKKTGNTGLSAPKSN